jgi:ketosteroid isomerase-like protein
VISEEPATPDLVELTRQGFEAAKRGDMDAAMSVFAPDAVCLTERFGRFEGRVAIRGYFEDWYGAFRDLLVELDEVLDLGNGVVFSAQAVTGRHTSSSTEVGLRNAVVYKFTEGLIVQSATYVDIEEGRAAAERLAREQA